jgi:DNA-binding protein YbaB
MFNKLKQIKDLRDQAKTMQSMLAGESVTVDKNGISLTMNGNMEVTAFSIANDLPKDTIASNTKDLINDAIKKMQRVMAQKMQQMGGLDKFGL